MMYDNDYNNYIYLYSTFQSYKVIYMVIQTRQITKSRIDKVIMTSKMNWEIFEIRKKAQVCRRCNERDSNTTSYSSVSKER